MAMDNVRPSVAPRNYAVQQFGKLHAEIASTARIRAVDEVGAEIAHNLYEPLTALLLYLTELKEQYEHSTEARAVLNAPRRMVRMALRETVRVCDIVERLRSTIEKPPHLETGNARDRGAAELSILRTNARDSRYALPPHLDQYALTPREEDVLAAIVGGASNKEGGYQLGISCRTFEVHRAHLMDKTGAKNAADLVRLALSEIR